MVKVQEGDFYGGWITTNIKKTLQGRVRHPALVGSDFQSGGGNQQIDKIFS